MTEPTTRRKFDVQRREWPAQFADPAKQARYVAARLQAEEIGPPLYRLDGTPDRDAPGPASWYWNGRDGFPFEGKFNVGQFPIWWQAGHDDREIRGFEDIVLEGHWRRESNRGKWPVPVTRLINPDMQAIYCVARLRRADPKSDLYTSEGRRRVDTDARLAYWRGASGCPEEGNQRVALYAFWLAGRDDLMAGAKREEPPVTDIGPTRDGLRAMAKRLAQARAQVADLVDTLEVMHGGGVPFVDQLVESAAPHLTEAMMAIQRAEAELHR